MQCPKCYRKIGIAYNEPCYQCYKKFGRMPFDRNVNRVHISEDSIHVPGPSGMEGKLVPLKA